MIVIVEDHNAQYHAGVLDQMFRLRARVFHDRLKWDVGVVDGRERDKYDEEGPVYLIYVDDKSGIVKGCLRLLPTTGPTVLGDIFADTLPGGSDLCSPDIWECSRFCTEEGSDCDGRSRDLIALNLIVALGETAIRAGIHAILANFDAAMLRLYRTLGCRVEVLGSTRRYGGLVYLGSFPVSEVTVLRLKHKLLGANFGKASSPSDQIAAA